MLWGIRLTPHVRIQRDERLWLPRPGHCRDEVFTRLAASVPHTLGDGPPLASCGGVVARLVASLSGYYFASLAMVTSVGFVRGMLSIDCRGSVEAEGLGLHSGAKLGARDVS